MQFRGGKVISIACLRGASGGLPVLLGFAPAKVLHKLSFADVLDELTGRGYQRRFNPQHSLDFRRYIQQQGSSTIPLTFNVRPDVRGWKVVDGVEGQCTLSIEESAGRVLSQVDCQHRLGHLNDLEVSLPFMCFVGLSEREEMEVFRVINGKAKGLSTSLLDFHDAQLADDLAGERPELFIALHLNNDSASPWHRQLDLGGSSTSGLARRASLRTMQKAIRRFLTRTRALDAKSIEYVCRSVLDFWTSVATVLPDEWSTPRKHLLTKGVGVYSLMEIAADLFGEATSSNLAADKQYFTNALSDFLREIDWSAEGPLSGLGGEAGVKQAVSLLRGTRGKRNVRLIANG
jgi:DNA sulfur modification protein DndB